MGKRNFFHGTMNASKSAQLLMQAYNFEKQDKTFAIFKPETDTRDKNYIKSRALDEKRPAFLIKKEWDGLMLDIVENMQPNFVFVDEIQFFTKSQVEELARISIDFNTPIFAYGLLLSYTGELFDGSKKAIESGFTLHELKMQCDYCTEKSTHHLLYIDGFVSTDGSGIAVEDEEFKKKKQVYKSVCYTCFRKETS